jgi:anti-sigma regulatory factor (Ser/Thr protein kinase)
MPNADALHPALQPDAGVARDDAGVARDEAGERQPDAGVEQHDGGGLDQPFDAEALFALRSAVAAHATEMGAGPAVPDIILVAHELSTNAVRHGGGSGRLRMWRSGDRLFCRVADGGPGLADPEHAGMTRPSPSVPGGRGLWIARQMAAVEIRTTADGTCITAAIPIPSDPIPSE